MFRDKILKIMGLALDISTNSDVDVFLCYSPHCDLLEVRVFLEGWKREESCDKSFRTYINVDDYRSVDDINNVLDEILNYLEKMVLVQNS